MTKVSEQAALDYHRYPEPGKIEVVPSKPYTTELDLSLAYSPGVAYPCIDIQKHPEDAYLYTKKGNLVAVISNGTAVLGLGNIGALSSKPVMEGKSMLFKIYGGLDAFDIEVNETDPDRFVDVVKAIAPTFGGINLEDIKAPECFYIEKRLRSETDIPVMHDDQHGTAIISAAALLNALRVQGKNIGKIQVVVNGAGAAAMGCIDLYLKLGVKRENVVMCDSKGVVSTSLTDLTDSKRAMATSRTDIHTLADAMRGADLFLGLSVGNVVTPEMLLSMAPNPIVFALANPDPEITYDLAVKTRPDVLMATGRSDYPNQINNVLGFPYVFRGAIDTEARDINDEMKLAAARALARLAQKPVPEEVQRTYGAPLAFGREYILPKPYDPRLLPSVAPAIAKAAMESGVAQRAIADFAAYRAHLKALTARDSSLAECLAAAR